MRARAFNGIGDSPLHQLSYSHSRYFVQSSRRTAGPHPRVPGSSLWLTGLKIQQSCSHPIRPPAAEKWATNGAGANGVDISGKILVTCRLALQVMFDIMCIPIVPSEPGASSPIIFTRTCHSSPATIQQLARLGPIDRPPVVVSRFGQNTSTCLPLDTSSS